MNYRKSSIKLPGVYLILGLKKEGLIREGGLNREGGGGRGLFQIINFRENSH